MSAPTFFNRLSDRVYLFFNSGIRVRVWTDPANGFQYKVSGNSDPRYERLMRYLEEMRPEGEGIIDAVEEGRGKISVRLRGTITEGVFEQRLRNMLMNL